MHEQGRPRPGKGTGSQGMEIYPTKPERRRGGCSSQRPQCPPKFNCQRCSLTPEEAGPVWSTFLKSEGLSKVWNFWLLLKKIQEPRQEGEPPFPPHSSIDQPRGSGGRLPVPPPGTGLPPRGTQHRGGGGGGGSPSSFSILTTCVFRVTRLVPGGPEPLGMWTQARGWRSPHV